MIHPWHILVANQMLMNHGKQQTLTIVQNYGACHFEGAVRIGPNVTVESGTVLKGPCILGKILISGIIHLFATTVLLAKLYSWLWFRVKKLCAFWV
ncbi:MAG: hypothetical protein CM1200mP28_15550 [Deltaproteobacteria bacterium]|nr:MAG: hypothetical protein CM1200mP28_15550 [Deltaproteobacteria bacterium]